MSNSDVRVCGVLASARRGRSAIAFAFSVPIAILGGLIGLGGAEFRLPVLVGPLKHPARQAVALNLMVSVVTIVVSLITRGATLSLTAVGPLASDLIALIVGGVVAAFFGAGWASRFSEARLRQTILVLLVLIGVALIVESFLPGDVAGFLPHDQFVRALAGLLFGLAIGLFSSMLGLPVAKLSFRPSCSPSASISRLPEPQASSSACRQF